MRPSLAIACIFLFGSMASGFSSISSISSSSAPNHRISHPIPWENPVVGQGSSTTATYLISSRVSQRGGAAAAWSTHDDPTRSVARSMSGGSSDSKSTGAFLASLWGAGGVIYILFKAILRVTPIALEPFQDSAVPLSQIQFGMYVATCLWFAYVEGYKGFQTKFSPLVVQRSMTLIPGRSNILHLFLAPLYSMGLFHATKKRAIVSWSITIGVTAIVAVVKRFPYPWRNIVDAGVIAGLSWGSLSIAFIFLKAWILGETPTIDPALPKAKQDP